MYDLVIKSGRVVDSLTDIDGIKDIAIKDGKICKIKNEIDESKAKESFNAENFLVVPGIIDTHVHTSSWLGGEHSYNMLALAGVTTAIDFAGPIEGVIEYACKSEVGINIGSINYIRPGETVDSDDPSYEELESYLEDSLEKGSIGYKILGGHYPLSSRAIEDAIEIANKKKAYVAAHVGSKKTSSNLNGLEEIVELSKGNGLHIAHINSYCRGEIMTAEKEAYRALELLNKNKNIISESYLSAYNGTSADCKNKIPESMVTRTCLKSKSYDITEEGIGQAILDGWANYNADIGDRVILLSGREGYDFWIKNNKKGTLSFNTNPGISRYILATERNDNNEYIIDAFSSDGGGIPRNEIVMQGLNLVSWGALTYKDFVLKASLNPAKMLGLVQKGSLSQSFDADITIIDPEKRKAVATIVDGKIIMKNGKVRNGEIRFITTDKGENYLKSKGLKTLKIDLNQSSLYK